jgi:hypothetical protein
MPLLSYLAAGAVEVMSSEEIEVVVEEVVVEGAEMDRIMEVDVAVTTRTKAVRTTKAEQMIKTGRITKEPTAIKGVSRGTKVDTTTETAEKAKEATEAVEEVVVEEVEDEILIEAMEATEEAVVVVALAEEVITRVM